MFDFLKKNPFKKNPFKKDPAKKVRQQYEAKLEAAMLAQRNGKIREYSFLTQEAETLYGQLKAAEAKKASEA